MIPPLRRRTVPLPVEIAFQPDTRGIYDVSKSESADYADSTVRFAFKAVKDPMLKPVEDPWEMRAAFLDERESAASLDGLTLTYGRFGIGVEDLLVSTEKLGERYPVARAGQLLEDEFRAWQSLIRAAMKTEMSRWPKLKAQVPARMVELLCRPMPLTVEWRKSRPIGVIRCTGILQALIATLQVDTLIGAEYRFCSCLGCEKSFKVKRHDQRYCSEKCKHRQVVRDARDRYRKAAQPAKRRTLGGRNK